MQHLNNKKEVYIFSYFVWIFTRLFFLQKSKLIIKQDEENGNEERTLCHINYIRYPILFIFLIFLLSLFMYLNDCFGTFIIWLYLRMLLNYFFLGPVGGELELVWLGFSYSVYLDLKSL